MFDNNINKIIDVNHYKPSNITSRQVPYSRKTVPNLTSPTTIQYKLKQIFDRMPDVVRATGKVTVVLKNGKTLTLNVNYQ